MHHAPILQGPNATLGAPGDTFWLLLTHGFEATGPANNELIYHVRTDISESSSNSFEQAALAKLVEFI